MAFLQTIKEEKKPFRKKSNRFLPFPIVAWFRKSLSLKEARTSNTHLSHYGILNEQVKDHIFAVRGLTHH